MSDTAILIENLSKQYRLGTVGTGTLHDDLTRWWYRVRGKEDPFLKIGETNDRAHRGSSEYVWALRDINLEVKQGEVLGIIGKNGAGKSTLLKILSKVTGPTTGSIKAKGRIASLLEVGTGFHPELTGRENIYLNGAILGMTKHEVNRKLDEIVDFAGVERYIDTPTKRYSSGMTVRLGFAVAAFLEEEILIVDEVLAVGDAEFQKKAIGKMQEVSSGGGRTVLFVSHNMGSINQLCSKTIWLENGGLRILGETSAVIEKYLDSSPIHGKDSFISINQYRRENPIFGVYFTNIQVNGENHIPQRIHINDEISLKFFIHSDQKINGCLIGLHIKDNKLNYLSSLVSLDQEFYIDLKEGENIISLKIQDLKLKPGKYFIDFGINKSVNEKAFDVIQNIPLFEVANAGDSALKYYENRPGSFLIEKVFWQ